MPSRRITLAIVAFWLIMAGLFVAQDVWPRLVQAEPQMFPADIVDEAGQQRDTGVSWLVFKNGEGGYRADTEWKYHSHDNSFESFCDLRRSAVEEEPDKREQPTPFGLFQFRHVFAKDSYFLTRTGRLISLQANTRYDLVLSGPAAEAVAIEAQEAGEQSAGRFVQHQAISFPRSDGEAEVKEKPLGSLTLRSLPARRVPRFRAGTRPGA